MPKARILAAAFFLLVGALPARPVPPYGSSHQVSTQSPVQDEHYKIRTEDTISILVQDVSEASGSFLVRSDGNISIPIVGEINIVGKTTKEIETLIADKLKREVKNPKVTVNVTSMSMQRIYVMGAVRSTGMVDWKPKWRLTQLIVASGGLSNLPERTKVLLWRNEKKEKELQLRKLLVDGDDSQNFEVFPGDLVNFQTDVTVRVQVVGQVGKQGLTEVLEGQGVAEVLAAAGGAGGDARLSGAKIVRKGKEIPVDLYTAVRKGDPRVNLVVEEGDTLYVPSLLVKVAVIGMVGRPGPITVPDGKELTLTEAVALAGGPSRQAKTDSIAIVRTGPDRKPVATKYDLKKLLKAQSGLVDPVLQDGDLVVIAQSGKAGMGEVGSGMGVFGFLRGIFPFFP